MKLQRTVMAGVGGGAVCLSLLAGCSQVEAAAGSVPLPPSVSVTTIALREIRPAAELSGRIEAVHEIEVRPQVAGYVASVDYTEGAKVSKGAVLFTIDERPFRAVLARANGELARTRARSELAKIELDRAERLVAEGVITQAAHDDARFTALQNDAEVAAAIAAAERARLDLEFTRVRAAVAGRAGQALVSIGDFVSAAPAPTLLTTLVSVDPVYVYFSADEPTFLRFAARSQASQVGIGLADETGFPHTGTIDFVDNHLDPATGAIRLRARVENPDGRLTPGLYARVSLPEGRPQQAIVIDDKAVMTDQDRKYVLVLNGTDTVERRDVKLGAVIDRLRVVADGLKVGDRVIVAGTQKVQPGHKAKVAAAFALTEVTPAAKSLAGGKP